MTTIIREKTIGGCRLILGDCLECLPFVGEFDTALVDPPYSIANKFSPQKSAKNGTRALNWEWDSICTPQYISERIGATLDRCKKSSSFFVWCGTDQIGDLLPEFRSRKYTPKPAAWIKKCPAPAIKGTWWPSGFEIGFYGYRNRPFFGDENTKRVNCWTYDSYRHGQPGKVDHPTQKPLEMMRHLVRSLVPPGGFAIDSFMGSGSTLVASIMEGRQCVGIEKEEKYFDIAVSRCEIAWQKKSSELIFEDAEIQPKTKQTQREFFDF